MHSLTPGKLWENSQKSIQPFLQEVHAGSNGAVFVRSRRIFVRHSDAAGLHFQREDHNASYFVGKVESGTSVRWAFTAIGVEIMIVGMV